MGVVRKGFSDVVTNPALYLGGVGAVGYRGILIPANGAHDCGRAVRASDGNRSYVYKGSYELGV